MVIAVAFNPLRVRLQRLLDRAFYGARRDPVRALAAVGERLTEVAAAQGDGLAGVLQALCAVLRLPWAAIVVDGVELAAYGTRPPDRHGVPIPLAWRRARSASWWSGCARASPRLDAADERVLALLAAPIGGRGARQPAGGRAAAGPASGSSAAGRRSAGGCAATCTTGSVRC